jgi:putative colanic acid biosynthesis UDP-glucose lipid carrier transferase
LYSPSFLPSQYSRLGSLYRLTDALLVGGSLWLLVLLYESKWDDQYSLAVASAVGLFLFFGYTYGLYRAWRGASVRQEAVRVLLAWLSVLLGLLFLAYVTKSSEDYSRRIILSWFLLAPFCVILFRGALLLLLGILREHGINTRTVAIVGARDMGARLAYTILDAPWMGLQPTGFYDDRKPAGDRPLANKPVQVLGDLNDLVEHAKGGGIDIIYIALPMRAEARIKKLIAQLSDTTASVYLVPDFFMSDLMRSGWSSVGGVLTIGVFETPFYGVDGMLKRVEDFVLASMILPIVIIPMLFIAIGIKLSSPGPVIFKQHRYGLRGNKVAIWKFRTMAVCEDGDDIKQAKKGDFRVTRFGSFLRRTSLDELPQFINVLQGRMSVVGPRPHAVVHNEEYRGLINGYMLRHKVKPGITGLAQVEGWRGETDTLNKMERRVECDLKYIRSWSVGLDLKIVFLTLFRGFTGKSAY